MALERPHAGQALALATFLALPVTAVAPAAMNLAFGLGAAALLLAHARAGGLRDLGNLVLAGPWRVAALLVVFAAASAPFALAPGASLRFIAYLAPMLAFTLAFAGAGTVLRPGEEAPLRWALHAGWAVGIVVLGVEVATGNGIALGIETWERSGTEIRGAHHNRGATVLVLMLAPLLAMLWQEKRKFAALGALAVSLGVLVHAESSTAKLALFVGAAGAGLCWLVGRRWPKVVAVIVALAIFAMPLLGRLPVDLDRLVADNPGVKISAFHRLYIWRFAADRIAERPWLGWGIDASRRIPGGTEKSPVEGQILGLHPHNGGVQLWLELGVVGGALGGALAGQLAYAACRKRRGMDRAVAGFVLAAALTFGLLSFGLWQAWWLGLLALAAALVNAVTYSPERDRV
jgi:O-antigen ligase